MMHGMDEMKKKAAVEALKQLVEDMMGMEGKEDPLEEAKESPEEEAKEMMGEESGGEEMKKQGTSHGVEEQQKCDLDDEERKNFMNGGKRPVMGKSVMVMKVSGKMPMKKGKK